MNTWIQTYSRRPLDLRHPQLCDIRWPDVALGLARTYRWRGQTTRPLCDVEHSILVGWLAERRHPGALLAGLMHDAHEGLLGDWPTPLMGAIATEDPLAVMLLRLLKERMQRVIEDALRGHPIVGPRASLFLQPDDEDTREAVRYADAAMLRAEAEGLLPGGALDDWTEELPREWMDPAILRGGRFVVGPDEDESLARASAWLSAVELACGAPLGSLVPLAEGREPYGYVAHDRRAAPPAVTWLGVQMPARVWRTQ